MSLIQARRIFRFRAHDLADPSPDMTPEEALEHYVHDHPELLGGKVIPPVVEGDALVYELRANFGDKG